MRILSIIALAVFITACGGSAPVKPPLDLSYQGKANVFPKGLATGEAVSVNVYDNKAQGTSVRYNLKFISMSDDNKLRTAKGRGTIYLYPEFFSPGKTSASEVNETLDAIVANNKGKAKQRQKLSKMKSKTLGGMDYKYSIVLLDKKIMEHVYVGTYNGQALKIRGTTGFGKRSETFMDSFVIEASKHLSSVK